MDVFPLVEEHRKGAILMAQGNQVTLVGNLTDDPELRYTPQGTPVATFTVAINRRTRDEGGQWKDGETSFFRCNVWRQQAEHVAESLSKGARAIVIGRLRQRSWETPEGQKRTVVEVEVESVGPSLEWATAAVTKTQRQDFGGSEGGGGGGGGAPAYANAGNGSNGAAIEEEPPF